MKKKRKKQLCVLYFFIAVIVLILFSLGKPFEGTVVLIFALAILFVILGVIIKITSVNNLKWVQEMITWIEETLKQWDETGIEPVNLCEEQMTYFGFVGIFLEKTQSNFYGLQKSMRVIHQHLDDANRFYLNENKQGCMASLRKAMLVARKINL